MGSIAFIGVDFVLYSKYKVLAITRRLFNMAKKYLLWITEVVWSRDELAHKTACSLLRLCL